MKASLLRSAWLAAALLIATGLLRLRFDVDVLHLLPGDIAAVQGLKLHQKHFANASELVLTVEASDPDEAERVARGLAEHLRGRSNLVRSAEWQPPWLENPASAAEFIAYLWLNQSPEAFGQLTNRLFGTNVFATLRETQQRLATTFSPEELGRLPHDPFNLLTLPTSSGSSAPLFNPESNLFSSGDGLFRLVFVQAAQSLADYRQAITWTSTIGAVIRSWQEQNGGTSKIQMTGGPVFTSEIAGGMEREMSTSVLSTAVIIAALFWLVHRRWKPLLWLLALLGLILVGTLALGGWVLGTLNVVSVGFAAILFGLADYGLVLYQEARAHPERPLRQIRRELSPSIFWSAVTTAGGFLLLNFCGLPGLGQLGTLVAMGVALAAGVMVFAYLPLVADAARQPGPTVTIGSIPIGMSLAITLGLLLAGIGVAIFAPPKVDYSSKPLRPRNSEAYAAMEDVRARLGQTDPHWLLVRGADDREVTKKLAALQSQLSDHAAAGRIARFEIPVAVWPNADNHRSNREVAQRIVAAAPDLQRAALQVGFTTNSLLLTERILSHWGSANALWPTSQVSRWVLDRFAARTASEAVALGLIYPATADDLALSLPSEGVWIAGWEMLGGALFAVVREKLRFVLIPMLGLVALTLSMAFRHPREVVLSLMTLTLSLLTLLVVMRMAEWSWNLLNLLAIPLLLGAGVDYSIHVQAALRRHGSLPEMLRSTGQAILLVGGTTIAGFGSLAWSSNAGLVSLGLVTASGLCIAMAISVFLLPHWWKLLGGRADASPISKPSMLYRAGFWRFGLRAVRLIPAGVLATIFRGLAWSYWFCAKARRRVVIENLTPVLQSRSSAKRATRKLFQQFAVKLVDLWRFESGENVAGLFHKLTGWEHFTKAHQRGNGVLLLTAHLGNWEFGAPLLVSRGIQLYVITLAEPGENFTELRQASRSRQGIETLVIGNDPFAFVEIIKKLQTGATIALLMDRPPAASAVSVKLFGKPFAASAAAAELARASGCALVPVILPRIGSGYAADVLPEVQYDRIALGKRDARIQLTQQIMRAFEPLIREYITQWYHFVPIWPDETS